uniref:Uncharacterized protein n=1 Tax=Kalanchoe fedtschenkoi TaxID=63787 RepID=A0A7N1A3Y8_KALFE
MSLAASPCCSQVKKTKRTGKVNPGDDSAKTFILSLGFKLHLISYISQITKPKFDKPKVKQNQGDTTSYTRTFYYIIFFYFLNLQKISNMK